MSVAARVTGSFTGTGQSGTFMTQRLTSNQEPWPGNVSLWGTFVGTVQLERSFDQGTTWLPITAGGTQIYVWTAPASETFEEPEGGVYYRLNCTAYTSGTINYRISQ